MHVGSFLWCFFLRYSLQSMHVLIKPSFLVYYNAFYWVACIRFWKVFTHYMRQLHQGNAEDLLMACTLCVAVELKKHLTMYLRRREACVFFTKDASWCSQLTGSWAAAESGWPSPAFPFPPLCLHQCACRCAAAHIRDLTFPEASLFVAVALWRGLPLVLVPWCSCRIAGSGTRSDGSTWLGNMRGAGPGPALLAAASINRVSFWWLVYAESCFQKPHMLWLKLSQKLALLYGPSGSLLETFGRIADLLTEVLCTLQREVDQLWGSSC